MLAETSIYKLIPYCLSESTYYCNTQNHWLTLGFLNGTRRSPPRRCSRTFIIFIVLSLLPVDVFLLYLFGCGFLDPSLYLFPFLNVVGVTFLERCSPLLILSSLFFFYSYVEWGLFHILQKLCITIKLVGLLFWNII